MISTIGRRTNRGFTLLELVLVMLILTIMAGLVAPSLRNFIVGRKNNDAVDQLIALGHYARFRAAVTGAVYRLNFDPVAHVYWLTKRKGATFEDLGEEFGRHFTLPVGMSAQWMPSAGGNRNTYIDFNPDGRIDASMLRIVDSSGKATEIGCRSETEPLTILNQEAR